MKRPKLPIKGKVIVLRNSFFEEFKPDIVDEFSSVEVAEKWIRDTLQEEPGDLYIICEIGSYFWSQVTVKTSRRRKG